MKELLNKISAAKAEIKKSPLKKQGRNSYSEYDYFTPSQIDYLVSTACQNNGLLTTFDLIRNTLGVFGQLTIYDLDTAQSLSIEMATEIPSIKATNAAQQLGGCVTYTERYLKMSFFGITDNKLDFDTSENTKLQSERYNALGTLKNCKTVEELGIAYKKLPILLQNELAKEVKELKNKFTNE